MTLCTLILKFDCHQKEKVNLTYLILGKTLKAGSAHTVSLLMANTCTLYFFLKAKKITSSANLDHTAFKKCNHW